MSTTNQPKKCVAFASEAHAYPEIFSKKQRKRMSYRSKDFLSFRNDAKETIRKAQEHKDLSSQEQELYCIRGLEDFCSHKKKSAARKLVVQSVLKLQAEHKAKGVDYYVAEEDIQRLSASLSKNTCANAQKVATKDSLDAIFIVMENRSSEKAVLREQAKLVTNLTPYHKDLEAALRA